MSEWVKLCSSTEVRVGRAKAVKLGNLALAVFNVGGKFFVTDEKCTHGAASLAEGFLEEDVIECPFHGGAFNVRTGEPVLAPCIVALRTYEVDVTNGEVRIRPRPEAEQ